MTMYAHNVEPETLTSTSCLYESLRRESTFQSSSPPRSKWNQRTHTGRRGDHRRLALASSRPHVAAVGGTVYLMFSVCVCVYRHRVSPPPRAHAVTHTLTHNHTQRFNSSKTHKKTPASDFIQSREPVSSAAVWNVKFHNVCFSLRVGLETQWIATLDQFILEWVSGEWCQPLRVETEGGSQRYHIYRRSTSHTALVLFEGMCVTGVF